MYILDPSMPYLLVFLCSALAGLLTLYSGFGLGTLLMPVYALFFPIEVAIAGTAVVHLGHNAFKAAAIWRHADWSLVLRFGVPAALAAFVGAEALGYVSHLGEVARYRIGPVPAVVTPAKILVAALVAVFVLLDLVPAWRGRLALRREHLVAGGAISGFFGGFSGHQGALRSAFLAKLCPTPQAFIGTGAVVAFMIDSARLAVYALLFLVLGVGAGSKFTHVDGWSLIATGIAGAACGTAMAKLFLHRLTMGVLRGVTGGLLLTIAGLLALGIV
jgi:uncharacterized protein